MRTTTAATPTNLTGAADAELELDAVQHAFGSVQVIDGLDLTLRRGEVVALVGPSGCGKSTVLELVAGLLEPSSGRISVEGGTDPRSRLARAAYMPQRDLLLPWLRAIDNAALALRIGGVSRRRAREQARPLFERLGLEGFERARPDELSGGMRQRVAFARTLLTGKPLLLLDEPFAALDAITRADLQEWLLEALAAEPRTVLVVTHDVEEALFVADRVVVLSGRPARMLLAELAPGSGGRPRAEAVTDPAFVAARERALLALADRPGSSR
jgi:ABC-type nitrate/sulfonate/bicarbonate transport system ATPase subunit